jgi:hypothetical protein
VIRGELESGGQAGEVPYIPLVATPPLARTQILIREVLLNFHDHVHVPYPQQRA